MSHRKFCAVALTAVGALALTALGVSPASAAGAGAAAATSSLQPATTLAPTIGVPTTALYVWPKSTAVALGQSFTFDASYDSGPAYPNHVVWTSSNPSVVTVDQEGHVGTVGVGDATITVTDKDDATLTSTAAVQVREVSEDVGIELSVPEMTMIFNHVESVNALLAPSLHDGDITWSFTPSSLGRIDEAKSPTAIDLVAYEQPGTGTLTAKVTNSSGQTKTATISVTVQPDPRGDFITDDNGVLTSYKGKDKNVVIPEGVTGIGPDFSSISLDTVWVPASVRSIDDRAFYGSGLKEITFQDDEQHPSQLTEIGDQAFGGTAIEHLTLPRSVRTIYESFQNMGRVKTIHLGPNIDEGQLTDAFLGSYQLEAIEVDAASTNYSSHDGVLYTKDHSHLVAYPASKAPGGTYTVLDGTDTIERQAFYGAKLSTLTLPSSLRDIGAWAFSYAELTSLTLPDGVESADTWAFSNMEKLTSLDVGGIKTLPDGAFIYAKNLRELNLRPDLGRLTTIAQNAFTGAALTSLTLPDSVTSIGNSSFSNNTSLTEVHVGAGLSTIGNAALSGNTALATITVNPANASFKAVDGVLYDQGGQRLALYPPARPGSEFEVPAGTKEIGSLAFDGASSLSRVTLPEGLTTIDYAAFYGCTNLVDMDFPESLEVVRGVQNTGLDTVILGKNTRELFMPTRENLAPRHLIVRGGINGEYYTDGEPSNGRIETAFFGEGMTRVDVRSKGPRIIVLPSTVATFQLDPFSSEGYKSDAQVYVAAAEGSPAWEVAKAELVKEGIDLSHLHAYVPASISLSGTGIDEAGDGVRWSGAVGAPVQMTATVSGAIAQGRELRVIQVGTGGAETVVQDWTAMGGDGDEASSLTFSWTPTGAARSLRVEARDVTQVSAEVSVAVEVGGTLDVNAAKGVGTWRHNIFGWWYAYPDGTYARSTSVVIDGKIYRFNGDGYMHTGWTYYYNHWYYHSSSGEQVTGWVQDKDNWYYLDPVTGAMVKGWFKDGSHWYYLGDTTGKMVRGWYRGKDGWYYLNPADGIMVTGWVKIGLTWYQFSDTGKWIH